MKVFVVYEYDYDDSRNHGAFSSYEKALKYVRYITNNNKSAECNFCIEEYTIDAKELT